ncbi:hypothetical protein SUSAZ_10210 [Sulfolobus acidocaldarius SUSAZ]|nr:hypothetical protein SUSAZ_10210 [Sulfolobus acidocaldarius SUSAZ]
MKFLFTLKSIGVSLNKIMEVNEIVVHTHKLSYTDFYTHITALTLHELFPSDCNTIFINLSITNNIMSSQSLCIVYIAGDVSSYRVVDYIFNGNTYTSFFSVHALWLALNPKKVIALVPDSLMRFECDDKEVSTTQAIEDTYKKLLSNKATNVSSLNSRFQISSFNQLLNYIKVEYIPNVGIGRTSVVNCQGQIIKQVDYRESRDPTFIYNVVYAILNKYHSEEGCEKFIVDLTHGTNVLVSTLLAAAAHFDDSDFYAAPIMGLPTNTQNIQVEIVELTNLVKALKDSLKIRLSIDKLDERYSVDYTKNLGSLNPNNFNQKHKNLIEKIKSTNINKVNNLLWYLRNGYVPKALESTDELSNYIENLQKDVKDLTQIYLNWNNPDNASFQNVRYILLPNFYSTLKVRELIDSIKGKNDIESMKNILDKYKEVEYYDKALSLARELPVVECLDKKGGGTIDDDDKNYKKCQKSVDNYIKERHNRIMTFRNYLMHSGLSTDLKIKVKDGKLGPNTAGNNFPDKNRISNYVRNELKKDVEDVINNCCAKNSIYIKITKFLSALKKSAS